MKKASLLFLMLWVFNAVAGQPSLTAKRLGEDHFELLLITDQTADVAVAQRALWPAARQLCAGKVPKLGHYKFQSAEPMPGPSPAPPEITLQQEVHCEAASVPSESLEPAAAVPHDDGAIAKLTTKYLGAKDKGNYAEAYGLFSDSMKASTSFESWSGNARTVNATVGEVVSRRIKKVTWYDNPPSAPVPGIYAAADYESEFEKAQFHCGYVVWLGSADGTFRIIREEENYIAKEAAAKMKPDQIATFAQKYGCEVR